MYSFSFSFYNIRNIFLPFFDLLLWWGLSHMTVWYILRQKRALGRRRLQNYSEIDSSQPDWNLGSSLRVWMRSMSNKGRPLGAQHHVPCTRTHQIGALLLVVSTFFFTRLFHRPCSPPDLVRTSVRALPLPFTDGGDLSWPDLKIYVYDEDEVDGLKALMYGRDGRITPKDCLKGQWGTQVFSLSLSLLFSCLVAEKMFLEKKKGERSRIEFGSWF